MVLPKDPVKREEALKNIKEAAVRRSQNPEWIRKNKEHGERLKQDLEWKLKVKEAAIQRSKDPEWRKHNIESCKKLAQDPLWREKQKEGCKIRSLDPEYRKKISIGNTGKVRTEEFKQLLREMNTGENNPFYGKHHESGKFVGENNGMYGKEHSKETKEKMGESHKGQLLGDKNPAWKGGITPLRKAIRESTEMYEWKRKVMERDDYRDVNTGERGDLEVHHVIPFEELLSKYNITTLEEAKNCKELWDIDNGITMLYENHRKFHGLNGKDDGE
jgi:hypothetical protein